MSENTTGARPDDATDDQHDTTDETQVLEATPAPDETQVLETEADTEATQVIETDAAAPEATQVLPTVGPDDPLSIFDQPSPRTAPVPGGSLPLAEPAFTTPPAPTSSAPMSAMPVPDYGPPAPYGAPAPAMIAQPATRTPWPPPAPLVRTTPRSSTIVWGFVILAIGIGVLSVVAGATIDVGLASIWLLAAAGAVLIVSSIVGAARRRRSIT